MHDKVVPVPQVEIPAGIFIRPNYIFNAAFAGCLDIFNAAPYKWVAESHHNEWRSSLSEFSKLKP